MYQSTKIGTLIQKITVDKNRDLFNSQYSLPLTMSPSLNEEVILTQTTMFLTKMCLSLNLTKTLSIALSDLRLIYFSHSDL